MCVCAHKRIRLQRTMKKDTTMARFSLCQNTDKSICVHMLASSCTAIQPLNGRLIHRNTDLDITTNKLEHACARVRMGAQCLPLETVCTQKKHMTQAITTYAHVRTNVGTTHTNRHTHKHTNVHAHIYIRARGQFSF